MESIREFYDFISEFWHFIKDTEAPAQDDNVAWDRIIDRSNALHRELAVKMADWMELLNRQSKEG